jgi:polysaccharide export outer membrane protein
MHMISGSRDPEHGGVLMVGSGCTAFRTFVAFSTFFLFNTLVPAQDQEAKPISDRNATEKPQSPTEIKAGLAVQPAAAVDPNSYKIGAEDVLEIRVWREAELSGQVRVRPDGKITLPLVGDVQASGLTPSELQKKAIEAFSQVLNTPQVIVSVVSVLSKKYYVSGMVERSGPFPLVTPTTVLEAISLCGLREWAKKGGIVIMRGKERLKFNYKQVIKGNRLEQNILLLDGDHIYVP